MGRVSLTYRFVSLLRAYRRIIDASMELNYVFVLTAVAVLWRPQENAKEYAYVMQLPAMKAGDDDESQEKNSGPQHGGGGDALLTFATGITGNFISGFAGFPLVRPDRVPTPSVGEEEDDEASFRDVETRSMEQML